MKYAVAFLFIAAALVYLAFHHGGIAFLLLWPAASLLIVAIGYAFAGSRVLGKDGQGRIAWWSRLLLLPYHLFVHTTWWVAKSISREPACAEVAPGVWIGRRVSEAELPPGVSMIVDLTSEFAEPRAVREKCTYICVPTLDAAALDDQAARAVIERIATSGEPVFIHCAQGHGRSGAFAAALLIKKGLARGVDEAVRLMQTRRPGVRLNSRQRQFVIRLTAP